jgi:hypothetical protein
MEANMNSTLHFIRHYLEMLVAMLLRRDEYSGHRAHATA